MTSPVVIMTGASGAGKTTLARTIRRLHPEISVLLEEELEPATEEFMTGIGPTEGPGGAYQRGFALHCMPKLAELQARGVSILLDCQCRIAFLREAIARTHLRNARDRVLDTEGIMEEWRWRESRWRG